MPGTDEIINERPIFSNIKFLRSRPKPGLLESWKYGLPEREEVNLKSPKSRTWNPAYQEKRDTVRSFVGLRFSIDGLLGNPSWP